MFALKRCDICNGYHAAGRMQAKRVIHMALEVSNINGPVVPADAPRKRLTAEEAMQRTKARYKETLAYLA